MWFWILYNACVTEAVGACPSDARGVKIKYPASKSETRPFNSEDLRLYLDNNPTRWKPEQSWPGIPPHIPKPGDDPNGLVNKCNMTQLPTAEASFYANREKWFGKGQGFGKEVEDAMDSAIARIPKDKTVIVIPMTGIGFNGQDKRLSASLPQSLNLLCNLKRLRLHNQLIIFPLDPKTKGIVESFGIKTFYPPPDARTKVFQFFKATTWEDFPQRFAKLVPALMLLERGRTVLAVDADTHWLKSPLPYLKNLPADAHVAATGDHCEFEVNGGFLYFKGEEAKRSIAVSMGSVRNPYIDLDHEQYHVDCGFAYAQVYHNVTVYRLPSDLFSFSFLTVNNNCEKNSQLKETSADTIVWHSGGFQGLQKWGGTQPVYLIFYGLGMRHITHDFQCRTDPITENETLEMQRKIKYSCTQSGSYHPACISRKKVKFGWADCLATLEDGLAALEGALVAEPLTERGFIEEFDGPNFRPLSLNLTLTPNPHIDNSTTVAQALCFMEEYAKTHPVKETLWTDFVRDYRKPATCSHTEKRKASESSNQIFLDKLLSRGELEVKARRVVAQATKMPILGSTNLDV